MLRLPRPQGLLSLALLGSLSAWLAFQNDLKVPSTATVTLNNGVVMPAIAAGLWRVSRADAPKVVKMALELGYTSIDTAIYYGNLKVVGKSLKGVPRSSYFLTVKIDPNVYGDEVDTEDNSYTYFYGPEAGPTAGSLEKGNEYHAFTPGNAFDLATQELEKNLVDLGVEQVDLALMHWPPKSGDCAVIQSGWAAMEAFYKAKKTRAIGVSNYCPSSLRCLLKSATVVPAINQVQYHVGMGGPDPGGIKSFCQSRGIQLMAYSPLNVGTPGAAATLITGDLVNDIGKTHGGKTGAQVALRWVWQNGVPLATRSTSREHLADNLDITDWSLSDDAMARLSQASEPKADYSFMCTE